MTASGIRDPPFSPSLYDPGPRSQDITPRVCYVPVQPWAAPLLSEGLRLLLCKVGTVIFPSAQNPQVVTWQASFLPLR